MGFDTSGFAHIKAVMLAQDAKTPREKRIGEL